MTPGDAVQVVVLEGMGTLIRKPLEGRHMSSIADRLERLLNPPPTTEREALLIHAVQEQLVSILAVADLHSDVERFGRTFCEHCGRESPCPTIYAINYPYGPMLFDNRKASR